ncbi:4Fe-4S cluster-binding domain-containing protein [Candidatus Bathyarchaeota archaeon]|nr:4Fe-4S cluster-binding domain-containing protein [Candidatus Bathyarchaeota archaeon]
MSGASQVPGPTCVNLILTDLCNRACPFCFLNDWIRGDEAGARHMSYKDLRTVIRWLRDSKIWRVKLAGGEPMLHPNLLDFVRELMKNRIVIDAVLTNGLGETELYEEVARLTGTNWLVNVMPPEAYTRDEWELLNRNLEVLRWRNEDASVIRSGFDTSSLRHLCLSITFYRPDQNYAYIIDLAKSYGSPVIRYDVSRPSADKSNLHIDFNSLKRVKPTLMSFVESCVRMRVKPLLDDALPFCMFNQKELMFLYLFSNFSSICLPSLDVMPDLRVEYCTSMRGLLPTHRVPEASVDKMFQDLLSSSNRYRNYQLSTCKNCYNWRMGLCQGYCLRFKVDAIKYGER